MAPAPGANDTDLQLVQRTIAGDQRAYGLLVMKYQRRIERLIARMIRDVDLAEEVTSRILNGTSARQVAVEPGRYIIADTTVLLTTVVDL